MSVSRRILGAAVLAAAFAFPMGVLANHQFSDVPTSDPYHADIQAIANVGVTTGCGGGKYCPNDAVTREQMAAFMNRLGALSPGKTPVVNADKLDGKDSTAFLGATDIVVREGGTWVVGSAGAATVTHFANVTLVSSAIGNRDALLGLDAPAMVGGHGYGLASVEICYQSSAQVVITEAKVSEAALGGATFILVDPTDRPMTTSTCFTMTDPTPTVPEGRLVLTVVLSFTATTDAALSTVSTTWAPVD